MNSNRKKITQNLAYVALFAAIITICTWISVPAYSGISFTFQTFAVIMAAALLGWRRGTAAVLVYIALGAVGAPVFSGFRGGIGVIGGVTGGYIVGFVFTAVIVGLAREIFGARALPLAVSMALGILVCYAFGTAWYCILYKGEKTLGAALLACVLPFMPFDALKIALAVPLSLKLKKYIGA